MKIINMFGKYTILMSKNRMGKVGEQNKNNKLQRKTANLKTFQGSEFIILYMY